MLSWLDDDDAPRILEHDAHRQPALVQLEANVLDWFRDWMGFPETTRGVLTTGGSMAAFNAVLCARERHLGTEVRSGVMYASTQAHHSLVKAARMAGVGRVTVSLRRSIMACKNRGQSALSGVSSERLAAAQALYAADALHHVVCASLR